jgi:ATP-dependent helicase YprA (DUF1998 family)
VVRSVTGYEKVHLATGQVLERGLCSLPNLEFLTSALWLDISSSVKDDLETKGFDVASCVHAVNHLLVNAASLIVATEDSDIATEHPYSISTSSSSSGLGFSNNTHRILLYDNHSGGVGLCSGLAGRERELLKISSDMISSCMCTESTGCPSCLLNPTCTSFNRCLTKPGAIYLLQKLTEMQEKFEGSNNILPGKSEDRKRRTANECGGEAELGDSHTPRKRRREMALVRARQGVTGTFECMIHLFIQFLSRPANFFIHFFVTAFRGQVDLHKPVIRIQRAWSMIYPQFVMDSSDMG